MTAESIARRAHEKLRLAGQRRNTWEERKRVLGPGDIAFTEAVLDVLAGDAREEMREDVAQWLDGVGA